MGGMQQRRRSGDGRVPGAQISTRSSKLRNRRRSLLRNLAARGDGEIKRKLKNKNLQAHWVACSGAMQLVLHLQQAAQRQKRKTTPSHLLMKSCRRLQRRRRKANWKKGERRRLSPVGTWLIFYVIQQQAS